MIAVSNGPIIFGKGDPKSTAARLLILPATGSGKRDTDMEIKEYGKLIWQKENREIMVYVLGMWRWAAANKGCMWREWTEPAREASLETAYNASPDLRYIQQVVEITGNSSDSIPLLEFAERYRAHRDAQGRTTLEYGVDAAQDTWKKFGLDGTRVCIKRSNRTVNGVAHKNIPVVFGVRWVSSTVTPEIPEDLI